MSDIAVTEKHVPVWNKRWLNLSTTGRPKQYTPEELLQGANEYFQYCQNNPIQSEQLLTGGLKAGEVRQISKPQMFMLEGVCIWLSINTAYFRQLEESIKDKTDDLSIRYSTAIKYIRDCIRYQRVTLAAANELNPLIVSRIEGLKDNVEHSGEIKQTYTHIVFQSRQVEDTEAQDITAQSELENL